VYVVAKLVRHEYYHHSPQLETAAMVAVSTAERLKSLELRQYSATMLWALRPLMFCTMGLRAQRAFIPADAILLRALAPT
jgi:hypothetical protein